ncbi:TIGR01777 family oxidoreductase [Glaciecola sp. 1036]|uniref:TIGR01777 family oxidoreductase n=1 Tax=Alteromonadaceae TaxID=72275 RepID=UPI003D03B074
MAKILITGGSGLIGRHFIKRTENKNDFTVVSRDPSRTRRLLGDKPNIITLDQLTQVDEYEVIVNLAGEPIADKRWSDEQKRAICDSRWDITQHLVDLINQAENPPDVFISGSAVGIYGRQGDTPITEDFTDYHDEFSHQVCSKWEEIALQANTRVCLLRTGVVLADEGGALAKMLIPFRLGLGGPIGSGKQYMPWVHLEDMIRAMEFLIHDKNCVGPFNITAPNPNTNHFFSLRLAERLQRPCFFRVPAGVLKFIMGESSELVLYGQKALPARLQTAGFTFHYPTLVEALNALDL